MRRLLGSGFLAMAGFACLLSAIDAEGRADCPPSMEQIPAVCDPPYEVSPSQSLGGCIDDGTGACLDDGCEGSEPTWGSLMQGMCAPGVIREGSVDRCLAHSHTELHTIHSWVTACQMKDGNCTCFWVQTEDETTIATCVCKNLPPLTN